MEMVSSKKQKVEEEEIEIETDTIDVQNNFNTFSEADASCSIPDQLIKVNASGEDGHVVSVLEDKSNASEEDTGVAKMKPVCAAKKGHIAAASEIVESNETSLKEDVAATINAPASLIEEDSNSSSKDVTILNEDVTAANLSPSVLSTEKSLVSIQKKDDSRTHGFNSAHETNTDESVAPAKKAPPDPIEKGSVVSWKKEDESCSDDEKFNKVVAENTSSVLTKKEDESNEELELDDETSSSDDDRKSRGNWVIWEYFRKLAYFLIPRPLTPATPMEHTTGGKTLFVGNLSFSVEQEDVEDFFKGTGEVVDIRFAMNSDETFKGYGYVKFASAEAAEKALHELNGKELLRRRVKLDIMKERGSFTPFTGQDTESFQKAGKAQGQTVFVRGFDKSDCQDEIRKSLEEHFGSCGEISRVSIPKDQDGCVRGIAYIEFKDMDAFTRALALNGSGFREGILSVKEAMPRGDSRDTAGSGRGYGRNSERYGMQDFGGRSGWRDFGGRSCWRDLNGRSGVRETGAWFGAGVWRNSSGRGDWQNPRGRGVWQNARGRGDWQNSSGRGDWWNSGGKDDWQQNSRDWQNTSGRGAWQNFSGRGDWQQNSVGRGNWQQNSREWQNSRGRGDWRQNSSGRGDWQQNSRDWQNSGGRGDWQQNTSGRGDWQNSGGRGVWRNSSGRGVWRDFSGRGILGNSNGRAGVGGTGVWFGRGLGTPIKPSIGAAPGAGTNHTYALFVSFFLYIFSSCMLLTDFITAAFSVGKYPQLVSIDCISKTLYIQHANFMLLH
ncbi:hypothetical protein C2S53_014537 [Perilla frutescens var. hirtella]|uniref:RRM domain-containing protein n=1 Tax=Perilla frutescens var. hirtella TaxID=608512 RepID=A0AAD4JDD5_PERFH|nr:hypothetical protein C2S53_014537 [Perilla frutescens var. hirtella]